MMTVLSPEEINRTFKQMAAENPDLLREHQEWLRQQFLGYYAGRRPVEGGEVVVQRRKNDKTKRLSEWIKGQVGKVVTPAQMAEACEGSEATAHAFINNNRSMFEKVRPGEYRVLDVKELRQEARRGDSLAALERDLARVMGHSA